MLVLLSSSCYFLLFVAKGDEVRGRRDDKYGPTIHHIHTTINYNEIHQSCKQQSLPYIYHSIVSSLAGMYFSPSHVILSPLPSSSTYHQ